MKPSTEGVAAGSAIGEARPETNKDAAENPNDPSLSIARTESAHPHIRKRAAKGNCFLTQSCSHKGADRDAEHKHELPIDNRLDVLPVSVRRHMFRGDESNEHAGGA